MTIDWLVADKGAGVRVAVPVSDRARRIARKHKVTIPTTALVGHQFEESAFNLPRRSRQLVIERTHDDR
jgi:hypothetical protein